MLIADRSGVLPDSEELLRVPAAGAAADLIGAAHISQFRRRWQRWRV
jgi:hypothetical protein